MSKYYLYLIALALVFSLSCCFPPEPVVKLSLDNPHKMYLMGAEYIKTEMGGIEANIAFLETRDGMYVFDVSITNYTSSAVSIDPKEFYYTQEITNLPSISGVKMFAYDPETKILEYEKMGKKEDASYANKQLGTAALSLLDLAADISTIGKEKTEEEIQQDKETDAFLEDSRQSNEFEHEKAKANINRGIAQWSEDAIRRTDLLPNEYIRGAVYFPARINAERINLFITVAGRTIALKYIQQKF